jgi:hypothetical protein
MGIDFRAKQAEFAAYIRDPIHAPAPSDVPAQRMAMYRELFFNNINSFLSSNFPVIRSLLEDAQWLALTQDFYQHHHCSTPHFSQIAEEFLDYLQNERPANDDFPFLIELAHYEWAEMALAIAQENPIYGDEAFIDSVMKTPLSLSPLAWPLAYEFPVHLISPDYLPDSPPDQASYLIVYRDPKDDVRFMQTTPLTLRLLALIEQQPGLSGEGLLEILSSEIQNIDPQALKAFGEQTLQQLAEKGVLIPAVHV